MPVYVTLFNFTDQGIEKVKNSGQRAKDARAAWEAAGGRFIGIWWTFGQYDGVVVHEAPDDKTANRLLFATGMLGNIRTTTMRAFGEEEIEGILEEL